MKVIYIREEIDTCDFVKRIIVKIKKMFNVISRKEIDNKIIYYFPFFSDKKISNLSLRRISKKTNKFLEMDESNIVVLSEYLNSIDIFKNYLYSNNIDILSGKFLFKTLSLKIIEYIYNNPSIYEVTFLVNDLSNINREIIEYISKNVKRVNIVTNHINKFKKIEEYLYSEFGIILNISNNKRRSLLKAKLILNIDFPEELVNKYRIYDESVIINFNEKINIISKRFNGININSFKIKMPSEYKLSGFSDEIVYESLIYKLGDFNNINDKITKDKVKIDKFIGNNGFIGKNNFRKKLKSIDKIDIKE